MLLTILFRNIVIIFIISSPALSNFAQECPNNISSCAGNSCPATSGCCDTGCVSICQKNCLGCLTNEDLYALAAPNAPCYGRTPRCAGVHSVFIPRSQGSDTARELVGWQSILYGYDAANSWAMNQVLEYSRSYRPDLITYYLFNRFDKLDFAGSLVEGRTKCDLIADYFGLAPDYQGSLFLEPRIENIYFDNQFFLSLEKIACGLYARFHLPIVHTRWNLHACPQETAPNSGVFPACYMSSDATPACKNLEDALSGCCRFGALKEPLRYGKFSFDTRTLTRLADIDCIIGYNAIQNPLYHIGLYGQLVVPTGNKPDPEYIFSPIVGNSKHWELGFGISAHRLLVDLGPCSDISVYFEGNLTHLFRNQQLRSFDFCHQGNLSRYMLLKEFETDALTPTGRFIPAINITTIPVNVSIKVQGDATLKFAYHDTCGLELDLGYNIYGKTAEDIEFCTKALCSENRYGFKGTEGTCYEEYSTTGTPPAIVFENLVNKQPLNATQNNAQIGHASLPDNPTPAPLSPDASIAVTWNSLQSGNINTPGVIRARISNPPIMISRNCLNIRSGAACSSITHAIFSYIGYIKENFLYDNWAGNIGLGAKIEFDGELTNERRLINGCVLESELIDRSLNSLNQWTIFVKGGISF